MDLSRHKSERAKSIDYVALEKLRHHDSVTRKFANVLEFGEEEELCVLYDNAARTMRMKTGAKLYITNNYVRHMDSSGHFTGIGFGRRGHNDANPLTMEEVSSIPIIVKTSNRNCVIKDEIIRNRQRYKLASTMNGRRQIVVVEVANKQRLEVVTSYILTKKQYKKYLKTLINQTKNGAV